MPTGIHTNPLLKAPVVEPEHLVSKEFWDEYFADTVGDVSSILDLANGVVI